MPVIEGRQRRSASRRREPPIRGSGGLITAAHRSCVLAEQSAPRRVITVGADSLSDALGNDVAVDRSHIAHVGLQGGGVGRVA